MKSFVSLVIIIFVLVFSYNFSNSSGISTVPQVKWDEKDFTHLPESFTTSPSVFSSLWARTSSEPVRIAVFGDSQETAPGGNGSIYIPRLNYEMYLRFGQVSETMVATPGGFGGGAPYASWLLHGATAPPGPSANRIDTTYLLPGLGSLAHSTKNNLTNVNGQAYGQMYILRHNAERLDPNAEIPTDTQYFCFGNNVRAEIIAATNASSGELRVLGKPTNNATSANYFESIALNQQITLGLESGTLDFKSSLTNILPLNGFTYHQIEINGDTDAKLTDVVGARFISDCNRGVVLQPLGAGGYQISHHLNNHANAGKLFKLLAFDAAIIHLGANDGGNDVSAATYKANLLTLIDRIRTWQEDPQFPIFLLTDIYQTGLSSTEQVDFDRYPYVNYEIALADPYVKFVNSRRLAHDQGLTPTDTSAQSTWLSDGVHYTPFGARKLAELEVSKLIN